MTLDPTRRPDPTDPRAGVDTLVSNTGQGGGAVGVDGALGLTLNVRVALEAGVTRARGRLVPVCALSIDATGTWSAGVDDFGSWCCGGRSVARCEGISNKTLITDANRNMVSNIAIGIDSTETRTRILTFSVDACLVCRTVRVDDTFWSAVGW